MKPLLERLKQGPILADGAMGTMLFERGVMTGEAPEALNLTKPEVLEEIAGLYLDAGAEILQTNTFGASALKLAPYNLADRIEEINRVAVAVVRKVADGRAYVCASCGPTGRLLKPYGDTEPEVIYDCFVRQIEILANAGIDAVNFETMIDLAELTLAVRAAKAVSPSLPVIATMTFEPRKQGFRSVMGNSISQVASGLTEASATVIGSNCGNGSEAMIAVAREFREASLLPVSIRPNAGLPIMTSGVPVYPETPEFMAERVRQLLDIGVNVIGGCCGTTPEHIKAFRAVLDQLP